MTLIYFSVITINTSKEHEPNSLPLLSNTTQNAQLPTQSSGESQVLLLKDLRKSPLLLTGEDLIRIYADNMSEDLKKSPSSSNAEDLINMDEDSLSEDGFMKILTCPSPVWWEDSSDKFDAGNHIPQELKVNKVLIKLGLRPTVT